MNYALIKDLIELVEQFDQQATGSGERYMNNLAGFQKWLCDQYAEEPPGEPDWEGKEKGRSAESVINTLIVHMNRYAKSYSKSAILHSGFSTQEEFIYLINLEAFGPMSKMDLIKKNVHEKPAGMQTINRLISQGWISQQPAKDDKRKKVIEITRAGKEALEQQMNNIRKATRIVTADLSHVEKMELIRLLTKLDTFHHRIYEQNMAPEDMLETIINNYLPEKRTS